MRSRSSPNAKFIARLLKVGRNSRKNYTVRCLVIKRLRNNCYRPPRNADVLLAQVKKTTRLLDAPDCHKDGLMRKQMQEFAETEFSLDTRDRFNLSCIPLKSEARGYLFPPSSHPSLSPAPSPLPIVVVRTHVRLFSPLQCSTRPRGVCSLFKRAYSLPRKST